VDFLSDYQTLLAIRVDRESRAAAGAQRRMTLLHRELDVLRVMIQTANDDQVLHAAGDKELAISDETEIARSKEPSLAHDSEPCAKCLLCFVGAIPITSSDAGA